MDSDIEIAQRATLEPITAVAARLGLSPEEVIPYGAHKAKIATEAEPAAPRGKLVLMTAISPTPAGEGKTTTTIGLADALRHIGEHAVACLREPSLGPCFGIKGGATGGGYAQVAPMEDINLHFTGDFHAITTAHNLLAALIDNRLNQGADLDAGRITWRRVMDMNDRALREIVTGLGGRANGVTREGGFDITVASEVMAILCLARDEADLKARLSRIVVGARADGSFVTAEEFGAVGAMAALLKDALLPNLVQTLEGTPAIIHGGPFANIAHGCNSVIATRRALGLADWVVTEAGFGADLGAEKFLDIKCRLSGLAPDAAVVVATVRALKMHGGVARADLASPDVEAVRRGAANLRRHLENVALYGVPVAVAVNRFTTDSDAEVDAVAAVAAECGAQAVVCTHWADGGAGAADLARAVTRIAGTGSFAPLYPDAMPLTEKIETVARRIYRAGRVVLSRQASLRLAAYEAAGYGALPVCIAKTQSSFSADPTLLGAPEGFDLPVRDVRLAAGAGFVVVLAGDIMTMPGLPKVPAAERIGLEAGRITGLS